MHNFHNTRCGSLVEVTQGLSLTCQEMHRSDACPAHPTCYKDQNLRKRFCRQIGDSIYQVVSCPVMLPITEIRTAMLPITEIRTALHSLYWRTYQNHLECIWRLQQQGYQMVTSVAPTLATNSSHKVVHNFPLLGFFKRSISYCNLPRDCVYMKKKQGEYALRRGGYGLRV